MLQAEGILQRLSGGLRVKGRVQHPQVKPRKDRPGWPWVFRYWADVAQPDGAVKTLRKYQEIGLSKGNGAITKKQAEIERDKFLAKLNAPSTEAAVQQVAATGVALLGEIATMYEEGYLGRKNQIARPTREKEEFYLRQYICRGGVNFASTRFNRRRSKIGSTPLSIHGGRCTAFAPS